MRIPHCGKPRRTVAQWLISQDKQYRYQVFYTLACPECRQTAYYWRGVINEDVSGPLNPIKHRDADDWIKRARWAAAGESLRDTASDHTHLLSRDTADSYKRVLKSYSSLSSLPTFSPRVGAFSIPTRPQADA